MISSHLSSLYSLPVPVQVTGSGLLFALAFLICRYVIFPKRSYDFGNRTISIVHSCVSLCLTAAAIDFAKPLERVGGQPTNEAEAFAMAVSLGYFTYDTICCILDTFDVIGNLHHVATIAGLVVGVFSEICGAELVGCLFLMEVSTPLMHLRCLFREMGIKDTAIAKANEVTFGVSYIICRVFLSSPLMYYTLTAPLLTTQMWEHVLVKAGATGIWLVSAFWLSKIMQVIVGKKSKKEPKED